MPESPTNEVVVSAASLSPSVSSLVVLLLPTLLEAAISSLFRAFRAQAAALKQGAGDSYKVLSVACISVENDVQIETRDAEDARDTKSINLCSGARKVG